MVESSVPRRPRVSSFYAIYLLLVHAKLISKSNSEIQFRPCWINHSDGNVESRTDTCYSNWIKRLFLLIYLLVDMKAPRILLINQRLDIHFTNSIFPVTLFNTCIPSAQRNVHAAPINAPNKTFVGPSISFRGIFNFANRLFCYRSQVIHFSDMTQFLVNYILKYVINSKYSVGLLLKIYVC